MKVEHIIGLTLILTLLVSSVQVAVAADVQRPQLPDPGTLPDSWMYGITRVFESVDLFFTFDGPARAEKFVNYAGVRLSEAKAMADGGKPEFVEGLVREYESSMNASNDIAKIARQAGTDVTKVTELIALATSVHLDVLDGVYEKVPEQAKVAVLKAKEASMSGQENALRALSESNPEKAASINLDAIEGRLSRAKDMAGKGKSNDVERALDEYEEMAELSDELAEGDEDVLEQVATDVNEQMEDLDDVEDGAPADVKAKVEGKKTASRERQKENLRDLAKVNPEKATEINLKAAENRLNEAEEEAEENDADEIEEVEDEVKEFENTVEFGNEISQIAKGLGKDTTTVEQLIAQATTTHLTILAGIYEKVPEQAKTAIEKAMNVSVQTREMSVRALKEKNTLGDTPEEIPLSADVKEKIPEGVPIGRGDFELLVSDAEADIEDFDSLIVSFSEARIFKSGESGGFEKFSLDETSVDLTEVVGEKAISVLDVSLPEGSYTKVELYVFEVDGTVNGSSVDVYVPSDKLQIIRPFVIIADEETIFVFDIQVVKRGTGEYNLIPVIGKSGVVGEDIPEEEVEEAECTVDEDCKKENQVCTDGVCTDVEEVEEPEEEPEVNETVSE